MAWRHGKHRHTARTGQVVVMMLSTLALMIFIVIVRMKIQIDVEVIGMHFVDAFLMMVDDHRIGAHFIHREDRNAENHENSQTTHDGQTGTAMPANLPGVGMVVAMFRLNHGKAESRSVDGISNADDADFQEVPDDGSFLRDGKENIDGFGSFSSSELHSPQAECI